MINQKFVMIERTVKKGACLMYLKRKVYGQLVN